MAEPTVPILSQSILERKPKLSGICPPKSLALMFGAGVPISIVVGVIAHYVGILLGLLGGLIAVLPTLLSGFCGFVTCTVIVFALIVIAVVVFGFPAIVGMITGSIIGKIGKSGNCRNANAAAMAGAFNGIITYTSHAVIAFLVYGNLHILTVSTSSFESIFKVTGTPWWIYVLIAIEALILIIVSASTASDAIEDSTFCEEHGVWYDLWHDIRLPIELAEPIARTLESGIVQDLENTKQLTDKDFPHLLIRMRKCPTKPSCDIEMAGKVIWQEKKIDKEGKESAEEHTKEWFRTMVSSSFGEMIETALGLAR